MDATTTFTGASQSPIPAAHAEAATRYINAIVRTDPMSHVGGASVEGRSQELWDQFEGAYLSLQSGPYARHGSDALRIALAKL